jgi:sarcosine oxidase subunit alpha
VTQPFRLPTGGAIDRAATLRFRFDEREYAGHPGDTLASALLANGVRLVGRSYKYHRPRGIFAAGPDEPNALVELRDGARREPDTKATQVELFDGLAATSQHRFPSLRRDLGAVNDLLGRFLPAGFYYKTFMWPASFWERLYEPLIRRAAGLGRAPALPDPDRYDTMHAHCDVLVVGAGPAGLAAALVAGEGGARVILCDTDFLLGASLIGRDDAWRDAALAALAAMPDVTLLPRANVFGAYDGNTVGVLERLADHLPEPPADTPRQRFWTIRAGRVIHATGAHERLIAFPGNDRPGVMLASAAATYVRRFAVAPGRRVLLFANNDAAYDDLFALQDAGLVVAGVVDPRSDSAGLAAARARDIAVWAGAQVIGTAGRLVLSGARVARLGASGTEALVAADLLCVSGGINPAVALASQAQAPQRWHEGLATWLATDPPQAQAVAGAAAGVTGLAAAAADGARAAGATTAPSLPSGPAEDATVLPLWEVPGHGKAFVDLQDDVTASDIRLAAREGYRHIEHAKRYTTHSMGTDQGKTGGLVGAAVLAAARGIPVPAVGMPAPRPFTSPVTLGAVAGATTGRHFTPTRLSPLHAWHLGRGAVMMDAPPWLRPACYPTPIERDPWDSILREARAVRSAVGICDVSTLGKIDVQGADAALFLDRIYANTISTLPAGRARYGLMLREDGFAFDDGTVSRLADDQFFVTTTTASAGAVMQHMEFYLQTVWPDLDVTLASVTDHWAAMSVAGPHARDTLAPLLDGIDLDNTAFPFMAVADASLRGRPVRVFRISFSGELAYELATPAAYAEAVWNAILEGGEPHGITPYGVEALGLLRIEKGHVAGPEMNGQTTAADLGLGRMLKKRGDFVGRALAARPALTDPGRPALAGVRALNGARLLAGAHLVAPGGNGSLGWLSSVTRGVEQEGWIGLALLADAAARRGTRLEAASPLHGERVEVEIGSPHFVDPENRRVHG